ncbi:hypothetical protein IFM89_003217 [Coptis chinensis]|uniref:S-protein homolog n=1 Tax=Coptis chinensis TaxID=261450 RepID=A0A835LL36_9MAGN|nr:hypothetical protein IFM89_003217 [Coptis chinensis]
MGIRFNKVARGFGFLLVLIALWGYSSVSGFFFAKIHVHFRNDIGRDVLLNFHCQSGNDDLGSHTLAYGQSFSWRFHDNLIDTTLFWCSAEWWDNNNKVQIQGSFDIYDAPRDIKTCKANCTRIARPDAVYGNDDHSKLKFIIYEWPRHKILREQNETQA